MNITPEVIGTALGTAWIIIVTAFGVIRQYRVNQLKNKLEQIGGPAKIESVGPQHYVMDEMGEFRRIDSVMDVATDYRERLERAEGIIHELQNEGVARESKHKEEIEIGRKRHTNELQATIANCDEQIAALRQQVQQLKRDAE